MNFKTHNGLVSFVIDSHSERKNTAFTAYFLSATGRMEACIPDFRGIRLDAADVLYEKWSRISLASTKEKGCRLSNPFLCIPTVH
jgi:hypothetical protein